MITCELPLFILCCHGYNTKSHRYVTSVSQLDGGFMLQTNVSHKMLRTDTVMDMLLDMHKTEPSNLQSRAVKEIVGQ